jgi:hypothetical protein
MVNHHDFLFYFSLIKLNNGYWLQYLSQTLDKILGLCYSLLFVHQKDALAGNEMGVEPPVTDHVHHGRSGTEVS